MFPPQTDGYNCGIFSLWYMLLHVYEDKLVGELNPLNWRRQTVFFIFTLHLYNKKLKDESYRFPKQFSFQGWLMEEIVDQDFPKNFQKAIRNIFDQSKTQLTPTKESLTKTKGVEMQSTSPLNENQTL